MHAVSRRELRHGVELAELVLHRAGQAGVAALEGVVRGRERELGRGLVDHHHDLLERVAVAAHVVGGVVDDVVIPATGGERGALHVHVAQLTVVGGRDEADAVQVIIVARAPQIALERVHAFGEEGRSNQVLDVDALVVADGRGIATAVRGHGRPGPDDAVASRADAVHDQVAVIEAGVGQITVVTVGRAGRARVARVEIGKAEAIDIEGHIGRSGHRDVRSRVVLDGDGLHVVGLVAEAVRGHPGAVQDAAAAGGVLGRGLAHELHAHIHGVAVGETGGVRVEPGGTSVLAVVTVVGEEHDFGVGRIVHQPLVALVASEGEVLATGHVSRGGRVVTRHHLHDFRGDVALIVEGDVVELDVLALLTIGGEVAARLERGDHVTGEAHGVLSCDGSAPAEPARESVVVAVVVVGSITQLEAEVLAGRLVVEVEQRSELPGSRSTHGVGSGVVQGVHLPEVRVHGAAVVVLEATGPVGAHGAAFEEEVNLQAEVTVVRIHHDTLEDGRAVLELREAHTAIGNVLHEVVSEAHVSVHVVELEEGVRTVVEVRVVSGRQGVPALRSASTGADLVASVGAALDRHHLIEFEVVAGKSGHVGSRGGFELALTLHGVVSEVTVNVKAGTSQAGVCAVQRDDGTETVEVAVAVELVMSVLHREGVAIGVHEAGLTTGFGVGELLTVVVGVHTTFRHELAEPGEDVADDQVTEHFLGQGVQVVTGTVPSQIGRQEDGSALTILDGASDEVTKTDHDETGDKVGGGALQRIIEQGGRAVERSTVGEGHLDGTAFRRQKLVLVADLVSVQVVEAASVTVHVTDAIEVDRVLTGAILVVGLRKEVAGLGVGTT